jgi:hypothetical protein
MEKIREELKNIVSKEVEKKAKPADEPAKDKKSPPSKGKK